MRLESGSMALPTEPGLAHLRQQSEFAARFFKGLGDPTRVLILRVLLDGEKSVGELVRLIGSPQGRVSTHLAHLRWTGMVVARRDGRNVYYRLADRRIVALLRLGDRLFAEQTRDVLSRSHIEEISVTYVISAPCIDVMDKSCVDVCPVDCIHFEDGEDRMLFINPEECIDCGACEPACPVNAIYPEDALPADMEPFKAINAQWYENPAAARAAVNRLKAPA